MTEQRCAWARDASDLMTAYHDEEWGRPSHDDTHLFEMLVLEGAQAGLSWATVLNKRENYRALLDGFDYTRIAAYDEDRERALLAEPGIIRNRLKVASLARNARAFLRVREEHGTFSTYLWSWVDGTPLVGRFADQAEVPASTPLSDRVSKDLKKRGFTFVGTTIVHSYLQSTGVVDDHLVGCPAKPAADPEAVPSGG
ncbi:DNA-3-methyladenine glycosylase I [Nocardiopsis lambiniae]|uniref:DNA-3-methyladenine glycosylase I n=1 Tax=Nocardiopsis lambiniae TaxID=3075539 RepID=A0ABU2MC74_9ACTN|nr:DNA-3-methyladenine glycosylase I [Nocardiopsis sp. DSM 44743]MDT0329861.1 DNA-3-methyladenine glycosylase I [Nocardiopsis sp. DSM 44743]